VGIGKWAGGRGRISGRWREDKICIESEDLDRLMPFAWNIQDSHAIDSSLRVKCQKRRGGTVGQTQESHGRGLASVAVSQTAALCVLQHPRGDLIKVEGLGQSTCIVPKQIDIACLLPVIDRQRHAMLNLLMLKLLLICLHRFPACVFLTTCPSRLQRRFQ
jgi:hypothetical protein